MMGLLKTVGKGILYIIGLPFFLLVLAITAVFGLFLIVFMFFKSIVFFFTGRSLDDELPEDRRAREIKEGRNPSTTPMNNPQETPVAQPYTSSPEPTYQNDIESAVFGPHTVPAFEPEPEPEVEPEPETETVFEQPVFNQPAEEPVSQIDVDDAPVERHENIGHYVPHTDSSRFIDVDEEEEDNSGVTISYGDDDD